MSAVLLDGKSLAARIQSDIAAEVKQLGFRPKLAVCLVGSDGASQIYVKRKIEKCKEVGFDSHLVTLPADATQEDVEYSVGYWCNRPEGPADGVLVQLPLPSHIDRNSVLNTIDPRRDVDCFHVENVGKLIQGGSSFKPCTPSGIMELLREYNIRVKGKKVVIINNTMVVGMPLSIMLSQEGATVTVCNEHSDVGLHTSTADIVVSAVGRFPEYQLYPGWVKKGAVVIDVAINRSIRETNGIMGDVANFDDMRERASYITPVPGGVGPLTVALLLKNTLTAAKLLRGIK